MGADALFQPPEMLLASVIDLDLSFVIQLGLFLLLYVLLSKFFFQPYAKILKNRDSSTAGMKEQAQDLADKAASLEESAASRLEQARQTGNEERRKLAAEGSKIRNDLIAQERERLQKKTDIQIQTLTAQSERFRAESAPGVVRIAELIEKQVSFEREQESI